VESYSPFFTVNFSTFWSTHHHPRINIIKRLDEIRLNVLSISIFNFMSAVNKKLIRWEVINYAHPTRYRINNESCNRQKGSSLGQNSKIITSYNKVVKTDSVLFKCQFVKVKNNKFLNWITQRKWGAQLLGFKHSHTVHAYIFWILFENKGVGWYSGIAIAVSPTVARLCLLPSI
jgi:hypothetical protein